MFRHGSLRDDRRRRSLLEDAVASGEDIAAAKSRRSSKSAEVYTQSARADSHARWSDFVPLRHWTLATFLAAGLLAIAALEAVHYIASESDFGAPGALRSFDLARADSLAGWFASLVMCATAVLSLFVYSVRRYRLDDYRGRYRVWLWGSVAWLIMSIDAVADLAAAVRVLGVQIAGEAGPGGGTLWWLAPWTLVLLWFGLRMLLDTRGCRTATASFLIGFAALVAGFVLPRVSLPFEQPTVEVMLAAGCSLVGRWLLLFAHVAYARHVLLDAHGQLPLRAAKPKREKKPAASTTETKADSKAKSTSTAAARRDDLTTRIDPPHTSSYRPANSGIDLGRTSSQNAPAKPAQSPAKVAVGASAAAARPAATTAKTATQFIGGRDDDESASGQKLSRAERKKLRKQQRAGRHDDE